MSKYMPFLRFHFNVVLLVILQLSKTQRRIKDGYPVQEDKRYAVYLLKAPNAKVRYSDWTCGGAIVSPSFVITSAACIEDVVHIYVIAGYRKFASSSELESDPCLRTKKKKVIFTCSPLRYNFDYNVTEKWANIDIAVVQVESPYDFNDSSFEIHCSYTPRPININYNYRYQEPGLEAMVMGWGHNDSWRSIYDNKRYNQEVLQYVPTMILDKQICIKYYNANKEMPRIINKYMICTLYEGNIDDKGEVIKVAENSQFFVDGCTEDDLRNGNECAQRAEQYGESEYIETERDITSKMVKHEYARKRRVDFRKQNTFRSHTDNVQNSRIKNQQMRKNIYDHFGQDTSQSDLNIDYSIDSQETIIPKSTFQTKYFTLPKSHTQKKINQISKVKTDSSIEYVIDSLENTYQKSSTKNLYIKSYWDTAMKNIYKPSISMIQSDSELDYNIDSQEKVLKKPSFKKGYLDHFKSTIKDLEKHAFSGNAIPMIKSESSLEYSIDSRDNNFVKITTSIKYSKTVKITTENNIQQNMVLKPIATLFTFRPPTYTKSPSNISNSIHKHTIALKRKSSPINVYLQNFINISENTNETYFNETIAKQTNETTTEATPETTTEKTKQTTTEATPETTTEKTNQTTTEEASETTTEESTETITEATTETTTEATTETTLEEITEITAKPTTEYTTGTTTISSSTTNSTIKNITDITTEPIDTTVNNNTIPETISEYTTEISTEKERPGEDLPGICQNDHGGPLVTWVGKQEVLIGVATLFKLTDEGRCRGPYLFTSTQCNSAFLNCILSMESHPDEMARTCGKVEEEGIKLVQRRVSWIGHRDGPADNERIEHRNQKSLMDYNI